MIFKIFGLRIKIGKNDPKPEVKCETTAYDIAQKRIAEKLGNFSVGTYEKGTAGESGSCMETSFETAMRNRMEYERQYYDRYYGTRKQTGTGGRS